MRATTHKSKQQRRRKRGQTRLRWFLALCGGSLVVLIAILLLLPQAFGDSGSADKPSAFGVTSVTVEGNTRYDEEAILQVSGITEGQSVFAINRRQVSDTLKKTFHYAEEVRVDIDFSRNVTIRITEAVPMGAVYADGYWVVVSHQGVGLQATPIDTQRPLRYRYIKGAGVLSNKEGEQVLDADSLEIIAEIFDAVEASGLEDISAIDIQDRSDLRITWNNQITILLGNDSNLWYEIAVVKSALPKVFEKHGETVTGQLNVSQYSDPSIESPAIVFTPSALLTQPEK